MTVLRLLAGVVMLVKGMAAPGGDFHVTGYRFCGPAPQVPLPAPSGAHHAHAASQQTLSLARSSAMISLAKSLEPPSRS